MIKIWCEWDIQQDSLIFRNEAEAILYLMTDPSGILTNAQEDYEDAETFEDRIKFLSDICMLGFDHLDFWNPPVVVKPEPLIYTNKVGDVCPVCQNGTLYTATLQDDWHGCLTCKYCKSTQFTTEEVKNA